MMEREGKSISNNFVSCSVRKVGVIIELTWVISLLFLYWEGGLSAGEQNKSQICANSHLVATSHVPLKATLDGITKLNVALSSETRVFLFKNL